MKTCLLLLVIVLVVPIYARADAWEFAGEASLYFLPDQTYLSPVVSADKNHFHIEARYNDESLDTGSIYTGYNFYAGTTVEMTITPLIGGVFGDINGVAPGFSFELNYKKLSLNSEGEYFFSSDEKESNFFYSWSEASYSPAEWIWFGIAGQRTRAFQTDLDIQRGVLIGTGRANFSITVYWMNPGYDDSFGLITAGYEF